MAKKLLILILALLIATPAHAGWFDWLGQISVPQANVFGEDGTLMRLGASSTYATSTYHNINRLLKLHEIDTPANPAPDQANLYIKDDGGGTTRIFLLDSGGTETDLTGGGGGCTTLDCLTDAVITSPVASSTLFYDGSNWVNKLLNFWDIVQGYATSTQGGTGFSTSTTGDLLYANATNHWDKLAIASGFLRNVSGIPAWSTDVMDLTTHQSSGGIKTFTLFPEVSGTPTTTNQLINKGYADALAGGFLYKLQVTVASTGAVATSGPQTVDGVSAVAGDRVLLKNQSNSNNNGCYVVVDPGNWTICTDSDTDAEVNQGTAYFVPSGTVNAKSGWAILTADPITPGSTAITFGQISGAPAYTGSAGVQLVGADFRANLGSSGGLSLFGLNTLWVDHDNSTLSTSTGKLAIANLGVTNAKIANSTIDLTAKVTGILPVANGGLNLSASSDDNVPVGNGTTWQSKALTNCDSVTQAVSYNTTTNTWGCNTITGSGGGSSGGTLIAATTTKKHINESVVSSNTVQPDDDLYFYIGANEVWTFRYVLNATSTATADIQLGVRAPVGASCFYNAYALSVSAATAPTSATTTCSNNGFIIQVPNTARQTYEVAGTIVNGSTAGTSTLYWSQGTSNATAATIGKGSFLEAMATSTSALSVGGGGTGQTSFRQGWLHSDGDTITASSSPTVNYITATSTTLASFFPYASTTAFTVSGTTDLRGDINNTTGALVIIDDNIDISEGTLDFFSSNGFNLYTSVYPSQATLGASIFPVSPSVLALEGAFREDLDFTLLSANRKIQFPDITGTFLLATGTQNFILGSGTTTNATTTTLASDVICLTGDLPCKTTWPTGGASFGKAWELFTDFLAPTTSVPILVNNATSTITNLVTVNATSTNATSTILSVSSIASTSLLRIDTIGNGCLNITSGLVGGTGVACGSGGGTNSKWATSTLPDLGIYPNNATYVGIGTTTPRFNLQLASSTQPQLALTDGVNNGWTFRNLDGVLYVATSSPTTFATSTINALKIDGNGLITTSLGLTNTAGQILVPNGAVGAPSFAFTTSPTSGIKWSGSTMDFVNGGTTYLVVNAGQVSFRGNTAAAPSVADNSNLGTGINFPGSSILTFSTSALERGRITAAGLFGIGTTTPRWSLQVSSSTGSQLTLSDTLATADHWSFRNKGGTFYLATSSPTTFATSSVAALTIGSDGTLIANKIKSTGSIFSSSATEGIGYTTGAGGSVTQSTSKSTGVTINAVSGRINTHNATLNADAEVSFTVTNSAVAAEDVVVLSQSAGTTNAYMFFAVAMNNGTFKIQITNISASNIGEVIGINFAIIKAVQS